MGGLRPAGRAHGLRALPGSFADRGAGTGGAARCGAGRPRPCVRSCSARAPSSPWPCPGPSPQGDARSRCRLSRRQQPGRPPPGRSGRPGATSPPDRRPAGSRRHWSGPCALLWPGSGRAPSVPRSPHRGHPAAGRRPARPALRRGPGEAGAGPLCPAGDAPRPGAGRCHLEPAAGPAAPGRGCRPPARLRPRSGCPTTEATPAPTTAPSPGASPPSSARATASSSPAPGRPGTSTTTTPAAGAPSVTACCPPTPLRPSTLPSPPASWRPWPGSTAGCGSCRPVWPRPTPPITSSAGCSATPGRRPGRRTRTPSSPTTPCSPRR